MYNKILENKLEQIIKLKRGFVRRYMFGGVGYLLNGNMCFGVYQDFLILRLGPRQSEIALNKKYTKPFDITGRAMRGWIMVHIDGLKTGALLVRWVNQAMTFVKSLPPKI